MARLDSILDKYDLKSLEAALQRRRRREEKEVERLAETRRKLEKEIRELQRRHGRAASGSPIKRKPNARRLNDISLADAIEKVMRRRRGPIHYKELTDTIQSRGLYLTKSNNLLSTVAVTLKRDDRFKKVASGMYALR
jgi:alanyl-tRNA synthetase